MFFSISNYASVSTQTSVLIIGGFRGFMTNSSESSIFEYKNDKWTIIGNLQQSRFRHQAIAIGSLVMIIGGRKLNYASDVYDYFNYDYYYDYYSNNDYYDYYSSNET